MKNIYHTRTPLVLNHQPIQVPVLLTQPKWLRANYSQEESATNGVKIIHQQHCKVSRCSESSIWKETISLVKHSHQVFYFLTSRLSINKTTILTTPLYFRAFYKANQIFIPHYVSLPKHTFQPYQIQWSHNNFSFNLTLCDTNWIFHYNF